MKALPFMGGAICGLGNHVLMILPEFIEEKKIMINLIGYILGLVLILVVNNIYNQAGMELAKQTMGNLFGKFLVPYLIFCHIVAFMFYSYIGMGWYALYVLIMVIVTIKTGTNFTNLNSNFSEE